MELNLKSSEHIVNFLAMQAKMCCNNRKKNFTPAFVIVLFMGDNDITA